MQFFPWNTSIPESFDIWYHWAAKNYDSTPGTIIAKIILQGYLDLHLKDIV